jgi:hypothetical protein
LVAQRASFDDVRERLKAGRPYGAAKTGRVEMMTRDHALVLDNVLEVPADYDPARTWPLRVAFMAAWAARRRVRASLPRAR